MRYDEEIEKLKDQVKALEETVAILQAANQAETEPEKPVTDADLDALNFEQIAALYSSGRIKEAQFGAAIARKFYPKPAEPVVAYEVSVADTHAEEIADAVNNHGQKPAPSTPEPIAQQDVQAVAPEATAKSSGDGQDAGDWTQAGDGLQYPGEAGPAEVTPAQAVAAEGEAPVVQS